MADITIAKGELNKLYEDALLGFIIVDPDKLLEVSEILNAPEYFSDPNNRAAYEVFLKLLKEDRFPGAPALLIPELYNGTGKQHFTSEDEAARYVSALMDAPTVHAEKFNPREFVEYANYIKWEKDKRDLQSVGAEMISASEKVGVADREEFISGIEDSLTNITMRVHGKDSLKHISGITGGLAEQLARLQRGEKLGGGIPTGIDMLDKTLNGLKEGELIVLAARPGVGKTTLSMQIAYNVAQTVTDGKRNAVLMFSLEMMEDQLASRMVATVGRVNTQAFMEEYGHLNDDGYYAKTYSKQFEEKIGKKLDIQRERSLLAMEYIDSLPIYASTDAGMSPNSIKSLVMQKKREIERNGENLALVVIDYLQLMVPGLAKTNANRTEEVGDMSRKMKLLAKEFGVPVLLLAQLNRNASVTERPDPKDLRESGSIEQDADKIMFIWSENAEKTPSDFAEYRDDAARMEAWRKEQMKVTITVAKNRQGETGDCPVIFDKSFQTFVSQSNSYAANNEQYNEFAEKYYQKTRTNDIFWPLMEGEIPEELERFRTPTIREVPYLTPDGQLLTLANDDGTQRGRMTIQSNPITPANQNANPAAAQRPELDKSTPAPLPVMDDLETGFAELPDEDAPATEPQLTHQPPDDVQRQQQQEVQETASDQVEPADLQEEGNDIVFDDEIAEDDELIDLDELDVLEQLSEELKG